MENSIEEDIKILEEFKTHGYAMLLMKYEDRNKTNLKIDQAIEHILSDYKRVLKENEELLEVKVSASAHNRILELEKENKELKERIREHTLLISPYYVKENFIPVQKVKDKIEHYQKLQDNYIEKYDEINEGLQAMINALQELLEGRK